MRMANTITIYKRFHEILTNHRGIAEINYRVTIIPTLLSTISIKESLARILINAYLSNIFCLARRYRYGVIYVGGQKFTHRCARNRPRLYIA